MNIIFIGKRFYTNRDALAEKYGRIYQLPWHWAQAGHDVRLWLVDYHDRRTAHRQDGPLSIASTPVRNLALFWHYLTGRYKRPGKIDVVVASGDCYIGVLAWHIARRLRARFVFDVYDKYDVFAGYWTPPGFDLFEFLMRRADACLFASQPLMAQTESLCRQQVLVPNGIDSSHFRPLDKVASRAAMRLPQDAVYVGYFGGMTPDRGVDDLIAAVHQLRAQGSPIQLLLGGKVRPDMQLDETAVRYLGDVPYPDMPTVLACCDLLAMPYRRSAFIDNASSCKIAEYIAAARPMVATRTPNIMNNFPQQADVLRDVIAEPANIGDLARAIREQLVNPVQVSTPRGFEWDDIATRVAQNLHLPDPETDT